MRGVSMILSRARVQILFLWLTQNPTIEEQKRASQVPAAILPKSRKDFRRVSAAIITNSPFSPSILSTFDTEIRWKNPKSLILKFIDIPQTFESVSNFSVLRKKNVSTASLVARLFVSSIPDTPANRLIRRNLLDGAIAFDKLKS